MKYKIWKKKPLIFFNDIENWAVKQWWRYLQWNLSNPKCTGKELCVGKDRVSAYIEQNT